LLLRHSTRAFPPYLQEMTWRFNNRKNQFLFRDALMRLLASDNLEKELLKQAEKYVRQRQQSSFFDDLIKALHRR
jgi:hypothetical protein